MLLHKWKALKELLVLLKIPYNATIEFQEQKLTLFDVYGKWIGMQLHLKMCITKPQFKSGLAKHLFDSLECRNANIFSNPSMVCALYLDPRKKKKQSTLTKLWQRKQEVEGISNNVTTVEKTNVSSD